MLYPTMTYQKKRRGCLEISGIFIFIQNIIKNVFQWIVGRQKLNSTAKYLVKTLTTRQTGIKIILSRFFKTSESNRFSDSKNSGKSGLKIKEFDKFCFLS